VPHSATATATTRVETAVFEHGQLVDLARARPDVGVVLYRNVAAGLSDKLRRMDERLVSR